MRVRLLGLGATEDEQATTTRSIVAASPENVALLNAVSDAASEAATDVVFKGLVGYTAVVVTSMATRKLGLGFLSGVALVSGVGFVAASALKKK